LAKWEANKDEWKLDDLKDFSQADNLADKEPERLATLQCWFHTCNGVAAKRV
jgi:hypothetical protein